MTSCCFTFCTLLAILSASSALLFASRASPAALPSASSACLVFSLAAMIVALMMGIFFKASSAAVLLSLTLLSKSAGSQRKKTHRWTRIRVAWRKLLYFKSPCRFLSSHPEPEAEMVHFRKMEKGTHYKLLAPSRGSFVVKVNSKSRWTVLQFFLLIILF